MGYSWNSKDPKDIQHKENGGLLVNLLTGAQEGTRRYMYMYLLLFAVDSLVPGFAGLAFELPKHGWAACASMQSL